MSTDTRIESLENQVRTLKRMFCGLSALIAAGLLVAATSTNALPEVMKVQLVQSLSTQSSNGLGSRNSPLYLEMKTGSRNSPLYVETKNGFK